MDTDRLVTKVGPPSEFSEAERAAYVSLVASGGQVPTHDLPHKVIQSAVLVALFDGAELIATSAIKAPARQYRDYQFVSARSITDPGKYDFELGYVMVAPSHRGRRLSWEIVQAAMSWWGRAPIYATTLQDNTQMHRVLRGTGFELSGHPYPDVDAPSDLLHLFVRS